MSFSFSDLNLSNVSAQEARKGGLPEGWHVVKIVDAKVLPEKSFNGFTEISITAEGVSAEGVVSDKISVEHPEAEFANSPNGTVGGNLQGKIVLGGLTKIKSLCEFGGHPNPNNPGDIKSLIGLIVGARVVKEEYEKDGQTRSISKLYQYDCFCRPEKIATDPIASKPAVQASASEAASSKPAGQSIFAS